VPYPIEINDSPQILVRHHTPEQFRDFIIGQFENSCASPPSSRWSAASRSTPWWWASPIACACCARRCQHIASHPQKDKVWFTRPSAIYDHCAALPKGTMVPPPA